MGGLQTSWLVLASARISFETLHHCAPISRRACIQRRNGEQVCAFQRETSKGSSVVIKPVLILNAEDNLAADPAEDVLTPDGGEVTGVV